VKPEEHLGKRKGLFERKFISLKLIIKAKILREL
jgi:hypothetical protein